MNLGGGQAQVDSSLGGVTLQQAVLPAEDHAQAAFQLGFQLGVAAGLGRLALERIGLAGNLLQNVVHPRQILLSAFQLGLGETLTRFELGDAGGFFNDAAAVLGLGAEDLADAALLDDGVAFRTQAGAHEQVLNVAQAGGTAVDEVFAFAGTEQAAGDGDFGVVRGLAVFHRP